MLSPDLKLDLPQIAVVGSQSSGKSSVLEALVGRDFLPRGSNIVTRRPLVLQLVKTQPASGQYAEWGEFLHQQGKRFYDFDRIRQEILVETERLVGNNKGISEKPIRLRIYSPNVLTMTLVDLPGITKVPVGDQPTDIEVRVRKMVLDFIQHPSCIILAVSPANQDIVNSDALDMARQVDPEGHRTIGESGEAAVGRGVLTKLDIMDRGTDAVAILKNEIVPLRLGYIGVVLRSQEDIVNRRSMGDARLQERAFFESRPEYLEVALQCGVANLARALNQILVDHIRTMLPSLRSKIEDAVGSRQKELRMYGDAPPGNTNAARGQLLLQLLDSYSTRFSEMLDGRSEHLPVTELAGGARIRHIFQEIFTGGLEALDPCAELTDEDVRTAIKNSGGIKGSLLIPEAPFELLVRRAIDKLLPPALQCKEYVHGELLRLAAQANPRDIARFPIMQTVLAEAVEEFINEGAGPAEHMIRNLVSCELAYINTSHPQFIGGNRAIAQVLERRGSVSENGDNDSPHAPAGAAGAAKAGSRSRSTGNLPASHPVLQHGAAGQRQGGGGGARGGQGLAAAAQMALRGAVEPEFFSPEDLLAVAGATSQPGGPPRGGLRDGEAAAAGPSSSGAAAGGPGTGAAAGTTRAGWFGSWFLGQRGYGDETSSDPGVDGEDGLPRPPRTLRVPKVVSDQEGVQVEVTRLLVSSYFDIVRKNLQASHAWPAAGPSDRARIGGFRSSAAEHGVLDSVPKVLMHFLVNTVQRGLQQHLIRTLYREELFGELMNEREDVAIKRQQCQENLRALRQALATLEGLPSELVGRVNASGKWNFRQMMSPDKGQGGPQRQQQQRLLTLEGAGSGGGATGAGAAGSPSKAPSAAALGYGGVGGGVSGAGGGPLANGAGARRPATAGQMPGQGGRSGGQYSGSPR
ncbi:hypothetical protein N2152v2_010428 [Parachlorella kessleri]